MLHFLHGQVKVFLCFPEYALGAFESGQTDSHLEENDSIGFVNYVGQANDWMSENEQNTFLNRK